MVGSILTREQEKDNVTRDIDEYQKLGSFEDLPIATCSGIDLTNHGCLNARAGPAEKKSCTDDAIWVNVNAIRCK